MKKVTKEVLKTTAHNLMFDMSEEEFDELVKDFDSFLEQLKLLNDVEDVDNKEPMVFPFDVTNDYLREDEVEEPLSVDDVLKNSSEVVNGQIRVPKVVK